jgi:hypothetical protein
LQKLLLHLQGLAAAAAATCSSSEASSSNSNSSTSVACGKATCLVLSFGSIAAVQATLYLRGLALRLVRVQSVLVLLLVLVPAAAMQVQGQ